MSRSNAPPRHGFVNDQKSRSDQGNGEASAPGSTLRGEAVSQFPANFSPTPDSSLKAALRVSMKAPAENTKDMITRVIRDAMTKVAPERAQSPLPWSVLPTIRNLVESRGQEHGLGSVKPSQIRGTGDNPAGSTPFGEYVGLTTNEHKDNQNVVNDDVNSLHQNAGGQDQGLGLLNSAGKSEVNPSASITTDSSDQSARISPGQDSSRFFRTVESVAGQGEASAVANEETAAPSEPFRFPVNAGNSLLGSPSGFQPFFSGASASVPAEGTLRDNQTLGDPNSAGMISPSRSVSSKASAQLEMSRLPSSSSAFVPFLGTSAGEQTANTPGASWTEGSNATSNAQGASDSSSTPFTSADPSTGQGVDLSRTNDLLQQLIDEYRRSRQSYLPLNDRNSSSI